MITRREPSAPRLPVYAGLFFITLATLMYELLLTRIFSVVTRYHFAFMAVSIGMLGGTAGALAVYLMPRFFRNGREQAHMAWSALLLAGFMAGSMLLLANIPFTSEATWTYGTVADSWQNPVNIAVIFTSIMAPFLFSGIAVTLALTRYPRHVSRLYAADLLGAALGCILVIFLLDIATGPTAIVVTATMAAFSGFLCSIGTRRFGLIVTAIIITGSFAWLSTSEYQKNISQGTSPFRLKFTKGFPDPTGFYEKWNSFSRIKIYGDPTKPIPPGGWGLSNRAPMDPLKQAILTYDGDASTHLINYDGGTTTLEFLKWDVINLGHELRRDANTLVIGSGGGRDLLSAIAYNQKHVTGVEINDATIEAITGPWAEFVGNLHARPDVTLVNDEARSYISRSPDRYDIIQISLIDTWAASSAGAYVLTENTLYTEEAWTGFLTRLTPGGILTCSRWYNKAAPNEVFRTVALASKALRNIGVVDPRKNMIAVRPVDDNPATPGAFAAALVISNKPLTAEDIARAHAFAEKTGFKVFLSPEGAESETMWMAAKGKAKKLEAQLNVRLRPPTDDNPFFFNYVKFKDILNPEMWKNEVVQLNLKATMILGYLLLIVVAALVLCVFVPLLLAGTRGLGADLPPLLGYFGCIGLGFMLIEISQMQRLVVFLGHPIYGLSVVLFAVLLSSGIGSWVSQYLSSAKARRLAFVTLLVVLAVFGLTTPWLADHFRSAATPLRITLATIVLFPMGFFLGMCFPFGMAEAHVRSSRLTAWLWGINGAASVLATVLAVTISLYAGISAAFWTGFTAYVVAAGIFFLLTRKGETTRA